MDNFRNVLKACGMVLLVFLMIIPLSSATVVNITTQADVSVYSPSPNLNVGTTNPLVVMNMSNITFDITYIKFNISNMSIPEGSTINSAKIFLYYADYGSSAYMTNISVYKVTENWNVSNVTYNTRPNTDEIAIYNEYMGGYYDYEYEGWHNWTVTYLFSGWHTGTINNYGVRFTADSSSTNQYLFNSLEAPLYQPYLSVNYTEIEEPTPPVPTQEQNICNNLGSTIDIGFAFLIILVITLVGGLAISAITGSLSESQFDFIEIIQYTVVVGVITIVGSIILFFVNSIFTLTGCL